MSRKEARRVYVMERVVKGEVLVREAAQMLGLSERQVKDSFKDKKAFSVEHSWNKIKSGLTAAWFSYGADVRDRTGDLLLTMQVFECFLVMLICG